MVGRTEARLCVCYGRPPFIASDRARALHERLWVADLHADSLLWGRDLLERGTRGHVDVPRLIEGNVALQVFAASTKSPRHLNIERNDDRSDDVILLALALGWPSATWRRLLPRALHMAARADAMAARSDGRLTIIRSQGGPRADTRSPGRHGPAITAGLLAIEGAHALDGDPANVEVVADAGFRMMSPSHFFDNAFGGSAHGMAQGRPDRRGPRDGPPDGGPRDAGRRGPCVVGHDRRRPDDGDAAGGRLAHRRSRRRRQRPEPDRRPPPRDRRDRRPRSGSASGRRPRGGEGVEWIARSIRYAIDVAGVEHVGLGSDFDGAVPTPFDATGLVQLTDALLDAGLDDDAIAKVMGGNARRLLAEMLPADASTAVRSAAR